jgi:hypothetical protein
MAVKKLRKIQMGLESVKGTSLAATTIWRGEGVLEDQLEVVFPEEDIGVLPGVDRSYIPKLAAGITIEDTPLTFEQCPILLGCGVDDIDSGAADGTGSGYVYTFTGPTTSDPGFNTYTIEGGDDQQAEEMEYSFATEITLKGAAGEAWMMGGALVGRQVSLSTFTGALSVAAVEEALFSKTKLYIDAGGGTIGTTQKSNTLLDAEVTITTGLQPVFTGDGELYFSFAKRVMPEFVLTITFEHDASSVAEKAAWRAQTTRLVRMECLGSALGTPDTETNKRLTIDVAGRWESFEALDEADGNDIVRGTLRGRYSSADTLYFQIVLVNEIAAAIT